MAGLDGADLLMAWERGYGEPSLQQALTLLAVGTGRAVDDAGTFDVGSRDVLLASLILHIAGREVWASVECSSCRSPLDVRVDVGAVAELPAYPPGKFFDIEAAGSPVSFRLPTTLDLAALSGHDRLAARRLLLDQCVRGSRGTMPEDMADAVEAAMEAVAPAGAVQLAIRCGECGELTTAALDMPALLWAEVEAEATRLLHDVHALARRYGWPEADVLALSPRRRAAYLELAEA